MFQSIRSNYRAHRPHSVIAKVEELLSSNPDEEYNAKYIAILLKKKPSSVRTALFRLFKEGKIIRVHRGFYKWAGNISESGHEVGGPLPKIHNIIITCRIPRAIDAQKISQFHDYALFIGDVKLTFSYGIKRRKITVRLSCDKGLDFRGFKLAMELIKAYILILYGFKPSDDDLHVVSCEINEDYHGLRVEGWKCLTVAGLGGVLERIYQKGNNLVRSEVKVKCTSPEAIYALLKGGVQSYNVVQGLHILAEKVEDLGRSMRYHNQLDLEMRDLLLKILERLDEIMDHLSLK
jgi:hypothetical protein